ncbi:MAG: hypothetical protein KDA70_00875 [Planctomycetaceae bacterium]|nr:hypothetical protein [Planctomycetaceae bacterium]
MKDRLNLTRIRIFLVLLCGLLVLSGCGENSQPLPETFVVKGIVKDKTDAPVKGGMIVFQSPTDAEQTSQAEIQADGSFQLFSLIEGQRIDGARAGEYRVTYYPRMSESQSEVPAEITQTFQVKAGENAFEIKIKE